MREWFLVTKDMARARTSVRLLVSVGLALAVCQVATAQWSSGFEPPTYNGSETGLDLNGQDDFYNPDPPGSVSAKVYTYLNNTLGIPVNPAGGGDQFVGATGPGGSIFARSQKDVPYGDGTGVWTASYDIAGTFVGTLPTNQNLGSFSLQPIDIYAPDAASYIALATWTDPDVATNWDANYVVFDAGNNYVYPAVVGNPAFQNLPTNHWFRWETTFDFDTNMITEVAITDLTTGVKETWNPTDWYLGGGAAGGLPTPTGFRFFAGAADPGGNTLAFDNLDIVPEPATGLLLALGGLAALRRRW